jgi:hypothetical protein
VETAVIDRLLPPEVPEHPDGHKSTNQQESFGRDVKGLGHLGRSVAAYERYNGLEDRPAVGLMRSISADKSGLLQQPAEQVTVSAQLSPITPVTADEASDDG